MIQIIKPSVQIISISIRKMHPDQLFFLFFLVLERDRERKNAFVSRGGAGRGRSRERISGRLHA